MKEGAAMSLNDLMPLLQGLPHDNKLRLLQFLLTALVAEEGINPLEFGGTFPIYTPYDAFDAANTLFEVIEQGK
jgi:hypothetical protein